MEERQHTTVVAKTNIRAAIMVDGAFYRKRAKYLFGDRSPEVRARELEEFCRSLLNYDRFENVYLYRIFYYDCAPSKKKVFHPLTRRTVDLGKSSLYSWMDTFLKALKEKRKFALRLGELSEDRLNYTLPADTIKKLCAGTVTIEDLTEESFELDIEQKGVDMKMGVDIASVAYKKQVDRIFLITGDSDFVPAAKLARREGIDVILVPMEQHVKGSLYEHIDGVRRGRLKNRDNTANEIANNVVQEVTSE